MVAVGPRVPERVGSYELHDQIATGGMARVFLGRPAGTAGACVAIKRMHEHLARDDELVELLLEEARLTRRLRHPNVVTTLDVQTAGHELLLVMEYVPGETLAELMKACSRSGARCPTAIAARIMHGVLLGLHAAHRTTDEHGTPLGIVHRDVSPQNVIVGIDGVPRLLDFGIAKAIDSVIHTRTGELRGKVPYMAPEILRFEPATPQSDVWAAAVVLWETLCRRRLFKGEAMAVWGQILMSELSPPGAVLGTPSPLDDVVMRGLARHPSERYASAAEMAEAIERATPLASPQAVADWVRSVAAEPLREREALVRRMEARPPATEVASVAFAAAHDGGGTSTSTSTRGGPWRGVPWRWVPWVTSGVLAVLLGVMATRRTDVPAETRAVARPETSAAAPPAAPSLEISAEVPSTAAAPSLSPPPSPPRRARVPPPTSPSSRGLATPVSARAASSCDPPFSIDEGGRKVFKLECVRGN